MSVGRLPADAASLCFYFFDFNDHHSALSGINSLNIKIAENSSSYNLLFFISGMAGIFLFELLARYICYKFSINVSR